MARGYPIHDVRRRLIKALGDANDARGACPALIWPGPWNEPHHRIQVSYDACGRRTLDRREIGNVTLWSLRPGQESFAFPDDYFRAASVYMECIKNASESEAVQVVRNCIRSGASTTSLVLDVVLPASDAIRDMYETGRSGTAEQNYLAA